MNAAVAAARQLVGQPFAHQGRGDACVDCVGVVLRAAQAAGIVVEPPPYGRAVSVTEAVATCARTLRQTNEPAPGTVAVFDFRGFGHFGLITPHPAGVLGLLHASTLHRKVIEHVLTPAWRRRIVALFALESR